MKLVAREMNLSETAFLHPVEGGFSLRWFTPTIEVKLCGHATLASALVLWETGVLKHDAAACFRTQSGWLTCIRDGNWIVRTRRNYAASGIASLLIDAGANPGAAVTFMRGIAPKVVIVAMSRGSTRVPQALSAKPDGVVFASSMLDQVRQGIGAPSALPPTLVIHHRRDECPVTHFSMAGEFMAWAGSRARLVWIDGGTSQGRICAGRAYHGFVGREGAVVGAITGFMRGLR